MQRRRISSKKRSSSRRANLSSIRRSCSPLHGKPRIRHPISGKCRLVTVHQKSRRRSSRLSRKARNPRSSGYKRSVAMKRRNKKPCSTLNGQYRVRSKKTGRCRLVETQVASRRRSSRKHSLSSRRRRNSKSPALRRSIARKYYRNAMAKKGFTVKPNIKARK
jgi:hypothetical protein